MRSFNTPKPTNYGSDDSETTVARKIKAISNTVNETTASLKNIEKLLEEIVTLLKSPPVVVVDNEGIKDVTQDYREWLLTKGVK